MGFVKTPQELSHYYERRVREFPDARMMGVVFNSDAELSRRLLPPPLSLPDVPGGLIFIAEYRETNLGPGYLEAALFLRCSDEGVSGSYCLSMPIQSEPNRLHNGRDIYGFPKKHANIQFEYSETSAYGCVERHGVRFVELKLEIGGTLPALPPTGPTYLFKGMPKVSLEPGFDGPVYLISQKTVVEPRKVQIGAPELRFQPSEHDPWSELEGVQPTFGFLIESSNRMLPGEILAEVDGDAYLPHYFRLNDALVSERQDS